MRKIKPAISSAFERTLIYRIVSYRSWLLVALRCGWRQAYALRALRFLFSVERNRRHFKRMFPAELFESFIDIGHYNRDISAYLPLVNKLNCLAVRSLDMHR